MKAQIGISSMRAALNSAYCMRAVLDVRKKQMAVGGISDAEAFHYQRGQHAVNDKENGKNGQEKPVLPPEVKVIITPEGKRWFTPTMGVELCGDVLEIRNGCGNIVDAVVLDKKTFGS